MQGSQLALKLAVGAHSSTSRKRRSTSSAIAQQLYTTLEPTLLMMMMMMMMMMWYALGPESPKVQMTKPQRGCPARGCQGEEKVLRKRSQSVEVARGRAEF